MGLSSVRLGLWFARRRRLPEGVVICQMGYGLTNGGYGLPVGVVVCAKWGLSLAKWGFSLVGLMLAAGITICPPHGQAYRDLGKGQDITCKV